jgi:hypothetical protein
VFFRHGDSSVKSSQLWIFVTSIVFGKFLLIFIIFLDVDDSVSQFLLYFYFMIYFGLTLKHLLRPDQTRTRALAVLNAFLTPSCILLKF